MLTLWDLIPRSKKRMRREKRRVVKAAAPPVVTAKQPLQKRLSPMAERYERLTRECLAEHGIRVRKWRSNMSGVAWEVRYDDGSVSRLIEAPRPKGPMSTAVFLHEVGHHAIGFTRYKPRCLEEYHAWMWSLREMERLGVTVTQNVKIRVHESLHYAILKAARRGLKELPKELEPFVKPPPRRGKRAA